MASIQPLMLILMNGSIVLMLWLGGMRISEGNMQVGDIIAFVNYSLQILQALMMVSRIFTFGVRAKTSSDRISEVFAMDDGITLSKDFITSPKVGSIVMESVSFCYPNQNEPVLRDISFSVNPGQTIAIIGSTGSGKSTLISLLPRLHDASEGIIKIDGVDIRKMELSDLRSRIAMVPQQAVLFSGTIAENLRWGNPHAEEEALLNACHIACVDEFILSLPKGLDASIGQGGINLSGGQKQRLAIARALLSQTEILILDDSTSAVDMLTEARIRQRLRDYSMQLTLIIIAQRIHSVMQADIILVLDEGRVVGLGTHDQLVHNCAVYQDLYRSQMGLDTAGKEVV